MGRGSLTQSCTSYRDRPRRFHVWTVALVTASSAWHCAGARRSLLASHYARHPSSFSSYNENVFNCSLLAAAPSSKAARSPAAAGAQAALPVHVVYGTSARGFDQLLSSVVSLVRRLPRPEACTIHFIIPEADVAVAQELLACLPSLLAPDSGGESLPQLVVHPERPLPFKFDNSQRSQAKFGFMRTPSVARLLLHEYLPDVSRALWLDIDTIVKSDPTPLFQMPMTRAIAVAATGKWDYQWTIRFERLEALARQQGVSEATYFNSGVLLMDLDRWKSDLRRKNVTGWGQALGWPYADQVALNMAFGGDYDHLDPRWNINTLSIWFRLPEPCVSKAWILHFNAGSKCFRPGCIKRRGTDSNDDLYERAQSSCASAVLARLRTVCDEPGECRAE